MRYAESHLETSTPQMNSITFELRIYKEFLYQNVIIKRTTVFNNVSREQYSTSFQA